MGLSRALGCGESEAPLRADRSHRRTAAHLHATADMDQSLVSEPGAEAAVPVDVDANERACNGCDQRCCERLRLAGIPRHDRSMTIPRPN